MRRFALHSAAAIALTFAALNAGTVLCAATPNDARVAELTAVLKGYDAAAQEKAFLTLIEMGPKAAGAVPVLVECLDDPRSLTRDFAITALGGIGGAAAPAMSKLAHIAETDADPNLRSLAKSAIGTIRAASIQSPSPAPAPAPVPVPAPAPVAPRPGMTVFSFLGAFKNDKINIEIRPEGDRYAGTITFGPRQFPFTGDITGITLTGQFKSEEGNAFDFTALYDVQAAADGSLLRFTTADKTQMLTRVTSQTATNPLGTRTTLTPARNPISAPTPVPAVQNQQLPPSVAALMAVVNDNKFGFDAGLAAKDKFLDTIEAIRDPDEAIATAIKAVGPLHDVLRNSKSPLNRFKACVVLGQLKGMARESIPTMVALLKDRTMVFDKTTDDKQTPEMVPLRAVAAACLAEFGRDAESALPALKEVAEKDGTEYVREAASKSVARIEKALGK